MTSVGKGGAGGPAKGLVPAHFFPLEGTALGHSDKQTLIPKTSLSVAFMCALRLNK